jgi:DNA-binding transcriptional LysR family regulator
MIELRKLSHILALAEAGSFARAARSLGITQSALSRSIQMVEEAYGFRIFERGKGPVVPTAAGRSLLPDAARLIQDARALDRHASDLGKAEAGLVVFGMGPLAAGAILADLLSIVLRERPGIRAHPVIDGGPDLVRRTLADELQFCCVADVMLPPNERMHSLPIARLPLAMIVRSGHPLLRGTGKLTDFPLIGGSTGEETSGSYEPAVCCDDNSILKSIVLTSDAVWLTAAASARAEIAAGKLALLPQRFDSPEQEIRVVIIRHQGRTLSPAARYIEDGIRRLAKEL